MARTNWSQGFREWHILDDKCHFTWCRLHFYPGFDGFGAPEARHYPFSVFRKGREIWVHCGPGAYLPKRPNIQERQNMVMACPLHVQMDLTCNLCLRHTFRLMEI